MSLAVAIQMDPIEDVDIDADSTFVLALEAQARGHGLYHYLPRDLSFLHGRVLARARTGRIRVSDVDGPLELSATTGAIEYRGRIAHPAKIDVTTGAIRLAVTPDSSFFVDAKTQSGKISADLPVGFMERPPKDAPTVRIRARTGAIRIVAAALGVIALPGILGAWQLWAASGGGAGLV